MPKFDSLEMKSSKPRVLDLFSGAGGFSLGFELSGCEIIGAIERDAWAAETFLYNHPRARVLVRDIDTLTDEEITNVYGDLAPEIIVGGPPCQGFSVCRRDAGDPSDPRNSLFREFVRACRLLSPKLVVMENVPNLLKATTTSGEKVIAVIERELEVLGYYVYHSLLEATDYGVPQMRKRLFVIASKIPLQKPFPPPTHSVLVGQRTMFGFLENTPTLWEAISDLPQVDAGGGAPEMDYNSIPLHPYQRQLREGAVRLHNHTAMKHSKRMVERFESMKCGESVSDVSMHLRPFARNSNGRVSTKVYDQNNRRMHPDRPCHTIPAAFYANFVHPFAHRNFTPREGARLQSFPDLYIFRGKPTVVSHMLLAREGRFAEKYLCQYSQIGNAVPPLMAKALAQNLIPQALKVEISHASPRQQSYTERAAQREVQRQFMQTVSF